LRSTFAISLPEKSVVGIDPLLHKVGERFRFVRDLIRVDPPIPEVIVSYRAADFALVKCHRFIEVFEGFFPGFTLARDTGFLVFSDPPFVPTGKGNGRAWGGSDASVAILLLSTGRYVKFRLRRCSVRVTR
jgi:hypothetical protein